MFHYVFSMLLSPKVRNFYHNQPLHNTSSPAASLGDPLVHSNARSRWLALLWNPWGYMTWEINYAQGYPNYLGFRGATVVHHSLHHGKRMKRKEKERKRKKKKEKEAKSSKSNEQHNGNPSMI
jgi:hypothetical protein